MRIPERVELVRNTAVAEWALEAMRPDGSMNDLWSFMPSGYDGYVRILHPLRDDRDDGSVRWADHAGTASLPIASDARFQDVISAEVATDEWMSIHRPLIG